jgi:hypothetical protein
MLDFREADDFASDELDQRERSHHVDGDDMTYPPVVKLPVLNDTKDNRTLTDRVNEVAAAVAILARELYQLKRQMEAQTGD